MRMVIMIKKMIIVMINGGERKILNVKNGGKAINADYQ